MNLYQLMLKKQWLMWEGDQASRTFSYQPQSCKDFYLSYSKSVCLIKVIMTKIPAKVSDTLKTALYQEQVVLVQLPVINGYRE